ncbi:hypothetical protein [Ruegeria atlantica]|uniref:hypothetical protein n=1 Tax=Ruegeria atlantica TaxID=81569 RepID=UPI0024946A8D|nr:hypothetical protein [Ruegeria atlantica]
MMLTVFTGAGLHLFWSLATAVQLTNPASTLGISIICGLAASLALSHSVQIVERRPKVVALKGLFLAFLLYVIFSAEAQFLVSYEENSETAVWLLMAIVAVFSFIVGEATLEIFAKEDLTMEIRMPENGLPDGDSGAPKLRPDLGKTSK